MLNVNEKKKLFVIRGDIFLPDHVNDPFHNYRVKTLKYRVLGLLRVKKKITNYLPVV